MKHFRWNLRAISPVLAVLMMIAVAIAGALVTYAWVMGYIGFQTEKSGEAIQIHSVVNDETNSDLFVYVQNVGETVVQLDEGACLYVDGVLVSCSITNVVVSGGIATLGQGDTTQLRFVGGAAYPGDKVPVKVTTTKGTLAQKDGYPHEGEQGIPGSSGNDSRFVIEGSFDVTEDGDLIKHTPDSPGKCYMHWKKIDVAQLTLSDMPLVHVYVSTYFENVENVTEPIQLWREVGVTHGSVVEDAGVVLYDEKCVYIYYKTVIDYGSPYALYAMTGNYKIVVVK